jgi:hypothetical protein
MDVDSVGYMDWVPKYNCNELQQPLDKPQVLCHT